MQDNNLCYATPESQGIPSEIISEFLDDLQQKKLAMHSFMLMRHGKVISEGYWQHFNADRRQRMYSISKSFTSAAIGMMIDEGKIAIDDKVADYFPDYIPENPHPHILEATIRHLLMMSACNNYTSYGPSDKDWVKTFFQESGTKHRPGTAFSYDTAATVVLCDIVEKISGKLMLEYMRPVFDEIGISKDITCIKSPDGRSWTGSGVLCTLRDLSRFALLCMNKGTWNGKQLISREYMEAATSCQINNSVMSNDSQFQYGYGYQFWCLKDGGFACLGMGGQVALCLPKYDLILTTTADNQIISSGIEHIADCYFALVDKIAKIKENTLSDNSEAQKILQEKISSLTIPLPEGCKTTKDAAVYSGKRYIMQRNHMGLKWISVDIEPEVCIVNYANEAGEHSITLGMGNYAVQKFPEKYFGLNIGIKDVNYDTIAAGAWWDEKTLLGKIYAIDDHLGTIKMQLTFSDDNICVLMTKAAEWFFDSYQGFATGYADK